VIAFRQFASRLGGPTTATTSPACPGSDAIGPAQALGPAPDSGATPLSPGGVPSMGTSLPSLGEPQGEHARASSLSRMEGLNRSCANTPGGGDSWLELSWARASTASLSRQRI
jgi:hypothetical protein